MSILKDAAEEQPNECRIIGGKPCSPFRLQFRQFTFANSFRKPLGPPRNENLTKDDDPPPANPIPIFPPACRKWRHSTAPDRGSDCRSGHEALPQAFESPGLSSKSEASRCAD